MNFSQVIDLAKHNLHFTNNEQLAAFLGFTRTGFYNMKCGTGGIKERTVRKLMDATGMDAVTIEGAWKAENAKDEKIRESWKSWLSKVASLAPLAIATALASAESVRQYILCKIECLLIYPSRAS